MLLRCALPAVRGASATFWCQKTRAAPFSRRRHLWWARAEGLSSQHRATLLWPSSTSSLLEVAERATEAWKETFWWHNIWAKKVLEMEMSPFSCLVIFSFGNLFMWWVSISMLLLHHAVYYTHYICLSVDINVLVNFIIILIFFIINTVPAQNCFLIIGLHIAKAEIRCLC